MKWVLLIVALWAIYAFAGQREPRPTIAQLETMRNIRENGCKDQFMHWCKRCDKGGFFCEE